MKSSYFSSPGKRVLILEFLAIYVSFPLIYALNIYRPLIIPVLILISGWSFIILLKDKEFDRKSLWRGDRVKGELFQILLMVVAGFLLLFGLVWMISPEKLFLLVCTRFLIWLMLIVAYPILSVYPQEILFRAFLFQRYRTLVSNPKWMTLCSGLVFAFAHIIFLHWLPVFLTFIGGLIFAWRYQRTRSLAVVFIEHSLFGLMMFTVGLAEYFIAGTMGLIMNLAAN